jgi:hypothetical protein
MLSWLSTISHPFNSPRAAALLVPEKKVLPTSARMIDNASALRKTGSVPDDLSEQE